MIRSAARSASVTGDPSTLPSIFIAARLTARIAAPARITRSVRGSISAAAASRSIAGLANVPHSWADLISVRLP